MSVIQKADYFRVPVTMPPEQVSFLENLGTQARMTGGYKLAKTTIIRALVSVAMKLDMDVNGVKTEEELVERIKEAIVRHK